MCANEYNITVKSVGEKFFDLYDWNRPIFISDYSYLDREILIGADGKSLKIGNDHKKTVANSIDELKNHLKELIAAAIQVLNEACSVKITGSTHVSEYSGSKAAEDDLKQVVGIHILTGFAPKEFSAHFDFAITEEEKNLLVEQLVFDMLFDKYLAESEQMTRNGYAAYMADKLCDDKLQKSSCKSAINTQLENRTETYRDRMVYSKLREQLEMLGINPEKFAKYYEPIVKENSSKKKPKYIWDQLYYNFRLPISSRQYRRQLTRENRNYDYRKIAADLTEYNRFVNRLLPTENESYEKYFRMSMDYYALESYKRVDFMFKIISRLPETIISNIDKDHFLVKRFHPMVLVPYVENDKLHFTTKHKYYRPLFMIENELLKEIQQETGLRTSSDCSTYGICLFKCQMLRAKTYELFNYHAKFVSTDYVGIKRFLQQCYNMRTYHKSTTLWESILSDDWEKAEVPQPLQEHIRTFFFLNEAFFWRSDDREYIKPNKEKL